MKKESKYSTSQRVAAIVCIVLIVAVYITALVCSLLKSELAATITKVALGCTLVLPVLAWGYIWMIGKIFHKHTIADFDIGGIPTDHSEVITMDKSKKE